MSDFKILKCPACGSSNVETDSESLLSCSHCGSQLIKKQPHLDHMKIDSSKIKNLLYVVILLILAIGGAFFWLSLSEQPMTNDSGVNPAIKPVQQSSSNQLVKSPVSSLPKLKKSKNEVTNESIDNNAILKPKITLISKIEGKTVIGGQYWIVTIRNDSAQTVVRPRVIMSMFDKDGRRIGEQVGWSKQDTLPKNSETTVLVLVSKPPESPYTQKMEALATFSKTFDSKLENIVVDDFVINKENSNNKYTIIGDVSNPNEYRVDFIWIQAIAKDKNGIAIGLADAYATHSSLAANETSGFKVTASTFIAQPPASWTLVAKGRKHRGTN